MIRLILLTVVIAAMTAHADDVRAPQQFGLTCIGDGYFPAPDGAEEIAVPEGTFEAGAKDWQIVGGEVAEAGRPPAVAPEGASFLQMGPADRLGLRSACFAVLANRPHLVSMWLRCEEPFMLLVDTNSPDREVRNAKLNVPSTGGAWKRVGFYFRCPLEATQGWLVLRQEADGNPAFALDDVRLRTAPEEEMTRAYEAWRAQYPERDLSPRRADGEHLALTIAKLSGAQDWPPERPFRIFAVGSSYTNFLGAGQTLTQQIRARFPDAPAVQYRKHVGSAVPYHFMSGWIRTLVVPAQPDLVLLYADGQPEGLEECLRELRAHTTADILVPSLHLRMRDEEVSDATINDPVWDRLREVCERYDAEWVDSRREWGAYVREHALGLDGLLMDAVHQTEQGALVINENIARHLAPHPSPSYDPAERERRLTVADDAVSVGNDGTVRVEFSGTRISVIGRRTPGGGSARVLIDGTPAEEFPAFEASYVQPGRENAVKRGRTSDRSPHWFELGEGIVPQGWVVTVTSAEGAFSIEGTVTGPDGAGNVARGFVSASGQIVFEPEMWRRPEENEPGDSFSFEVTRRTVGEVSFAGEEGLFRLQLADRLANGPHVLELVPEGAIDVETFEVFTPPAAQEGR